MIMSHRYSAIDNLQCGSKLQHLTVFDRVVGQHRSHFDFIYIFACSYIWRSNVIKFSSNKGSTVIISYSGGAWFNNRHIPPRKFG